MSNDKAEAIIRNHKRNRVSQRNVEPTPSDEEAIVIEDDNEVEQLATDMSNELIKLLTDEISANVCKANLLKGLDNVLYITSHLISLTILILGLYGGASNVDNDWFFITSILSGVNGLLIEIGKRYDFKSRSKVIYECTQDMFEIVNDLRRLKVDKCSAEDKLTKINEIESLIKEIQLKIFNKQVIKTTVPG